MIEMAPQNNFPAAGGPLRFVYGSSVLTIPDCKIDKASVQYNERGQIVSLSIYDWRWRWVYPAISGWYNQFDHETGSTNMIHPDPDAEIDVKRVRSARDLAKICLMTMGVKVYDVSVLPTDIYPAVEWDYENAALALQSIADQCGCVVVPTLAGSVLIAKKGLGKPLPVGPLLDGGVTIDPPEIPDSIEFVGGHSLFQIMFPLRAVGLDTDGIVKPINSLSFAPEGGWETVDPCEFYSLDGGKTSDDVAGARNSERELAQRTIWKWYQVHIPQGGLTIPGFGKITDITEVMPLNDFRLEYKIQDGQERRQEATVFGIFAKRDGTAANEERKEYPHPFQIERNRGIVIFDRPVFKYAQAAQVKFQRPYEASLALWTSCSIRVQPHWAVVRSTQSMKLSGAKWNTGPKYLIRDDVVYEHTVKYNKNGVAIGYESNKDEIKKQIDYYLKAELDTYLNKDAINQTYAGILPIGLDGAIWQVTWSVGPDGSRTQASRNSEHSDAIPPFDVRKRWDQIRRVAGFQDRGVKRGSPATSFTLKNFAG
jgi:hypothetical protein